MNSLSVFQLLEKIRECKPSKINITSSNGLINSSGINCVDVSMEDRIDLNVAHEYNNNKSLTITELVESLSKVAKDKKVCCWLDDLYVITNMAYSNKERVLNLRLIMS